VRKKWWKLTSAESASSAEKQQEFKDAVVKQQEFKDALVPRSNKNSRTQFHVVIANVSQLDAETQKMIILCLHQAVKHLKYL